MIENATWKEQVSLFEGLLGEDVPSLVPVQELPDLAEFDTRAMLAMEKEMTGVIHHRAPYDGV